eukprot:446494-Amphidinium_carterae.1
MCSSKRDTPVIWCEEVFCLSTSDEEGQSTNSTSAAARNGVSPAIQAGCLCPNDVKRNERTQSSRQHRPRSFRVECTGSCN